MLLNEKNSRLTLCGELSLLVAVIINSFSVVLMLYSGSGISAISSVPFAFSEAFPKLTRYLDLHFPRHPYHQPDVSAQKIYRILYVQLCCRLCVQPIP